ncbi:MAG: aminopeptidase N [Azospirillaceae bacterium]|nr:aminopeptidase N [Azospirillaceae bacterium]
MNKGSPAAIRLSDYRFPAFLIDTVDLQVDLGEEVTRVRARLSLRRNPDGDQGAPLVLDGHVDRLLSLSLDGRMLTTNAYRIDGETLTIDAPPPHCLLDIETELKPQENTALEGLYQSKGNFCTQCEPQGFRKITYYIDRPDVMARFTTTITGDRARYPVLLSNGNLVGAGDSGDGRHWVRWEDPFPKPCYLFALVAGRLSHIEDRHVTRSGRVVTLRIYTEPGYEDKCHHAMASLKRAMTWDETAFGLEYDLDIFMIVAVGDFNMGAMENKGLNIFNTKYILARPDTATDSDYRGIEAVVAHEYFHNWTGDRVTCRDWFQLSLKEGLTVFRDQEFSSDMQSRPVKRIADVQLLRSAQFAEDAGPMAHPVRPDSYIEINNFYTATVYEKGAEIVRMIHTLLGADGFRRGMDLYFVRHDGHAVTCDDFVQAMEDANSTRDRPIDFTQFRRWYAQAGTPVVTAQGHYDAEHKTYRLTLRQSCPPTPGQPTKAPFHIPVAVGLIGRNGCDLPLRLARDVAGRDQGGTTRILELTESEQTFEFLGMTEAPVPSLLRGFSAPVHLRSPYSDADLTFLMAHDSDPFNRWEAGQVLATRLMLDLVADFKQQRALSLDAGFVDAFARILTDTTLDSAFAAQALTLPSENDLGQQMAVIEVEAIHAVRQFVRRALADMLGDLLHEVYRTHHEPTNGDRTTATASRDPKAWGRRALKNLALAYLTCLDEGDGWSLCLEQYRTASDMTDSIAALSLLADSGVAERDDALADFYQRWRHEPLVLDKWFAIQASSSCADTLQRTRQLLDHPAFDIRNPNKVYSLIGRFSAGNPIRFHDASGAGYRFLADQALVLDRLNPQVASRMVKGFARWRHYDQGRQALMRTELERIRVAPGLSPDVFEVVTKSLMATETPGA